MSHHSEVDLITAPDRMVDSADVAEEEPAVVHRDRLIVVDRDLEGSEPTLEVPRVLLPRPIGPEGRRGQTMVLVGRSVTLLCGFIALFALYLFALSGIAHERSQASLLAHFRVPLAFQTAPLGGNIRPGSPIALVTAPAIGLHEVVVEGTDGADLERGPGHLRTSPLPGQAGNSVIAGRRLSYGGPFSDIGNLRAGDRITVVTGEGRFTYRVDGHRTVRPGQRDVIATTNSRNLLTLMTSDPPVIADKRLVVTADLVGAPKPTPPGRPNVVGADELALGSGGISPTLVLWLILLLAGCVATVMLYRRLQGWTAYLLTTPVLLAIAFLLFDNLAGALPATL